MNIYLAYESQNAHKLPGFGAFGYNRVPTHFSLRTAQKNRRFTAATIIIHCSRRWCMPLTYGHASSTEHQYRGGCSPRTVTPRWMSVSVFPVPTTRTKPPPDRWSYSTAVAKAVWESPCDHLSCDHECVCNLPLTSTDFSIIFVIDMLYSDRN